MSGTSSAAAATPDAALQRQPPRRHLDALRPEAARHRAGADLLHPGRAARRAGAVRRPARPGIWRSRRTISCSPGARGPRPRGVAGARRRRADPHRARLALPRRGCDLVRRRAGLGLAAAEFLSALRPSVVGADTFAVDVTPPVDPEMVLACHQHLIMRHGIHLHEGMNLDLLAEKRRFTFAYASRRRRSSAPRDRLGSPFAVL